VVLAGAFFALLHAIRSRRPDIGLAGALALAVGMALEGGRFAGGFHTIAQASLVFLLLHSLRWRDIEHSGSGLLRWLAALAWVAHAGVWTRDLRWEAILTVWITALIVLAAWLLIGWLQKERHALALPAAALVVLGSGPAHWLLRHGSDGLLALLGSFVLFAAGIVVAWTRHRWEGRRKGEGGG
jgi:hypothetical protein